MPDVGVRLSKEDGWKVTTETKAIGWECPKCKRVWGPNVVQCGPCNRNK